MENEEKERRLDAVSPEERRARIGKVLWKRLLALTALILPWTFLMEALAGHVRDSVRPCILAGDFNHTPWSPTFRRLLREGKLLHGRVGRGYLSTWPRGVPFLRLPIDHVLVTEGLAITGFRRFPAGGSDHNPVQAEIRFTAPPIERP